MQSRTQLEELWLHLVSVSTGQAVMQGSLPMQKPLPLMLPRTSSIWVAGFAPAPMPMLFVKYPNPLVVITDKPPDPLVSRTSPVPVVVLTFAG